MKRRCLLIGLVLVLAGIACEQVAQAQPGRQQQQRQQRPGQGRQAQDREEEPEPPPLPTDERLLALHRRFVDDAERLALEYERTRDFDKAMDVYREILKLVPRYQNAQTRLAALEAREASAQQATCVIQADGGWQDTGIIVMEGKPLAIAVDGTWTFVHSAEVTADGMEIPEELRDYNMGCLLGVIDTGNPDEAEPFVVGSEMEFTSEVSGKLYMRMYDIEPSDNEGQLTVHFQGTFRE